MPNKPKKPCNYPSCLELTTERYCTKHKQDNSKQYNQERGTAVQRGYDSRWRKARLGYLRKHPLCVECERQGQLTPATVVDHIRPHKGDKTLFWDVNNWQSFCASCHNRKTAKEDGGFGNRYGYLKLYSLFSKDHGVIFHDKNSPLDFSFGRVALCVPMLFYYWKLLYSSNHWAGIRSSIIGMATCRISSAS